MRRVITFLGTRPIQTSYLFAGREYRGRQFAEALCQFLSFDEMLVFATPQAQETTWPLLADLGDPRIKLVPISLDPRGEHLWGLFQRLTECVAPGDRVIFDLTHGLRHVPFVVFLAAAYLTQAQGVEIEAVYYGAYELAQVGKAAPVVDLSPLVSLLSWLTAAGQFVHTGDARLLAGLLLEEAEALRQQRGEEGLPSEQERRLRRLGRRLEELSLALMLCRPLEVMRQASPFAEALRDALAVKGERARPFQLLAQRIQKEYANQSLPNPTAPENVEASLCKQLELVAWYREKNQLLQAATLAREWLVTALGWRLGKGFVLGPTAREELERGLSGLTKWQRGELAPNELNPVARELLTWPAEERKMLSWLFDKLGDVRNDLNHAGMRENARSPQRLRQHFDEAWEKLQELARCWGVW